MNRREIFDRWAPPESIWTPWVKPVLFAHLQETTPPAPSELPEIVPAPRTALVIDLPGAQGVQLALSLAQRFGLRPVPLYNAAPGASALVDVDPIVQALSSEMPPALPPDAPPIFLLDANRNRPRKPLVETYFDNRSVSLFTDFPSAAFLRAHGIERISLVGELLPDVARTLRRWQDAGLPIFAGDRLLKVAKPAWYRWPWERFIALLGFRRDPLGGFGALISPAAG